MTNWRDNILNDFVPNVSKLTLVADPDNLLTEEKLVTELHNRGFDLIEFDDPVEFRYAYESKYRSIWDRGEHTDLVVILRLQDSDLDSLPYDLLQVGRKLSFNIGELFPNFSYPVIEKLDRHLLDALYDAQCKSPPDRMGDNATKDYILRNVYKIASELISNNVDLLRVLLFLHYGKVQLPCILNERLIDVLNMKDGFASWPLEQIIPDDKVFFAFIQERWLLFLNTKEKTDKVMENRPGYSFKYSGPDYLEFDHQDIRVYIDNLFIEGYLTPVKAENIVVEPNSWIISGIESITADDDEMRITKLFDIVEKEVPTTDARYSDWSISAMRMAELSSLIYCRDSGIHYQKRIQNISDKINATFSEWLNYHYASMISLPPNVAAMVHHIPRRLARSMDKSDTCRVALIVVDGLALDQWVTVRQLLQKQDSSLVMREATSFAWIPTLTSVSRQSIFSGSQPLFFPSSINSTNSEEKHWKRFWEDYGLSRLDVSYKRGLGDGDVADTLDAIIHPNQTKAVGLVVDKVDKIMHGMQLGTAGMHNQIKQWCQNGYLYQLIDYLLNYGYEIWLTSDHGNIECNGKGRPSEGVIAEIRGQRVRVYPTPEFCSQTVETFTFANKWQPVGLPADYYPLVAGGRNAFVNPNNSIVGHGGISVEEVIVPFINIERMT